MSQPESPATGDAAGPAGLGVMASMSPACTPLKHRYDACFNKWLEEYLGLPTPRGHNAPSSFSRQVQPLEDSRAASSSSSPSSASSSSAPFISTSSSPDTTSTSVSASDSPRSSPSSLGFWRRDKRTTSTAPPTVAPSTAPPSSSTASSAPLSASPASSASHMDRPNVAESDDALAKRRSQLRRRLDAECGEAFRTYQACVLRAVEEKQLTPLIHEARRHNPFPFPHETRRAREEAMAAAAASQGGKNPPAPPPPPPPNNEPFPFPAATTEG